MRHSLDKQTFSNVGELEAILSTMDDYDVLPAVVYHENFLQGLDGKVGIMTNLTKKRQCMPTSLNYPVFDHKTAFGYVVNSVRKRGGGIHGHIETWADRAYLSGMFDDIRIVEGTDADGIVELGFHLENAMDRKIAFVGDGYTFRLRCSNGAMARSVLPAFMIHEWHTINMEQRVPPVLEKFLNGLLEKAGYLQEVVNIAIATTVKFETQESLSATMEVQYEGISNRHIRSIVEQIKTLEPSRWDMYNAASYVTSHKEGISPDIRNKIDDVSSKFLNMTEVITPVVPEMKMTVADQAREIVGGNPAYR